MKLRRMWNAAVRMPRFRRGTEPDHEHAVANARGAVHHTLPNLNPTRAAPSTHRPSPARAVVPLTPEQQAIGRLVVTLRYLEADTAGRLRGSILQVAGADRPAHPPAREAAGSAIGTYRYQAWRLPASDNSGSGTANIR